MPTLWPVFSSILHTGQVSLFVAMFNLLTGEIGLRTGQINPCSCVFLLVIFFPPLYRCTHIIMEEKIFLYGNSTIKNEKAASQSPNESRMVGAGADSGKKVEGLVSGMLNNLLPLSVIKMESK